MDVYQRRRLVALSAIAGDLHHLRAADPQLRRRRRGRPRSTPVAGATGAAGATAAHPGRLHRQADAICLEANTALADVDESDPAQAAGERGRDRRRRAAAAADAAAARRRHRPARQLPRRARGPVAIAYDDKATAAERGDDAAVAELDATIDEAAGRRRRGGRSSSASRSAAIRRRSASSGGGDDTSTDDTATTDTGAATAPPATDVVPDDRRTRDGRAGARDGATDGHRSRGPPGDRRGGTDSSSGGVSP